jgi:2-dehydropantoate 2-reductase
MAGHQVTLVGRPALVEAVNTNGLILEMAGETHVCPATATTDPSTVSDADMVLFCVKSGDTENAGAQIAPYLKSDTPLLSLQNGISNPEALEKVTGHAVIAAVVYMASAMAGPGVVRHEGRGELAIGGRDAERVAGVLNAAQIPTEVSENVIGLLWSKLVINCAYNAISAVGRQPYATLVQVPGMSALIDDIVQECMAVASAEGVRVPDGTLDTVRSVPEWMPNQFSSTAQDIMRGRTTEIDYLNGEIARRAEAHGIAAPINRTLTLLTKLVEPNT